MRNVLAFPGAASMAMASVAAAGMAGVAAPAIIRASGSDVARYGKKDDDDLDPKALVKEFRGLKTDLQSQHAEVQKWTQEAAKSIKDTGEIAQGVKDGLAEAAKKGEALAAKFGELEQLVAKLQTQGAGPTREKSTGEIVVGNDKFQEMAKSGGGKVRVGVKAITSLTSGAGAAGDLIVPQRNAGIIRQPDRLMTIRNLLTVGRTTSNSIEYVQETGFTNAAAPVAEGGTKPESSLEFTLQTTPVRTIAHWIQASKQILQDVPALQSYIDTRLRFGLELVEEDQILSGDGTGQNLLGLIPQSTPFDVTRVKPTDTRIDIVRRAMTQVRIAEYRADAIVMHPSDWEEIELTKTDDGSYVWANPRGLLGPTLWGLPVIDTTAVEEGEFLVGNFQMAAMIWDREEAVVDVSTEDRDNFIKNMVTIRAEERLALEVSRPEALIYGDFEDVVSG